MARIRNIKPEFFDNEELAVLGSDVQLCFIGLWTQADCEGRMEDRPSRLRAAIFPYRPDMDFDAVLSALEAANFIIRYEILGKKVIWIKNFTKHQYVSTREKNAGSDLPGFIGKKRKVRDKSHTGLIPERDRSNDGGRGTGDGGHRQGTSLEAYASCPALPADGNAVPPDRDFFLAFQCNGPVKEWKLPVAMVEEFKTTYRGVDIEGEMRKAKAWTLTNTRKTAKGMPRFLNGWLNRAANQLRANPGAAKPAEVTKAQAFEKRMVERWGVYVLGMREDEYREHFTNNHAENRRRVAQARPVEIPALNELAQLPAMAQE